MYFQAMPPFDFRLVTSYAAGSPLDANPRGHTNIMGINEARSAHELGQANDKCQDVAVSQSSTPPPYTSVESTFTESAD